MKARSVKELIDILKTLNPESTWYGFDDGTINIETSNGEISIESCKYDDLIENPE